MVTSLSVLSGAAEGSILAPEGLGPYRVTGILGQGGMGVVYRGIHSRSGEEAAIKTVTSIAPKLLSALRAEVQALKRTRHPGIVRVIAEGLSDELPWYAMECLEGQTLDTYHTAMWSGRVRPLSGDLPSVLPTATGAAHSQTLKERPASAPKREAANGELSHVLRYYRGVCAALDHIHRRGLIHRDLKPSNVFLRNGINPVLMDFGLASKSFGGLGREALVVDSNGRLNGTLPYVSPEQLRGELVDARADLYALGCMLYETIVGHPPFSGSTVLSLVRAHLDEAPAPPSQHVNELPPALDSLILQLLSKSPHDRMGRAEDVDAVLAALLDDAPKTDTLRRAEPYLYRPRLTGREDALAQIEEARLAAAAGKGRVLLIGGESGIGKTFLVAEAARRVSSERTRVLIGECQLPSGSARNERTGSVPLAPFRNLLQYVADCCRQGGRETTDRLLGARCRLLVSYEPSFSYVPGQGDYPDPPRLEAGLARRRILRAVEDTIQALAEEAPLLLALDDLQWADELTIELLRQICGKTLPNVLVLGTYRNDELSEGLNPLLEAPGLHTISLAPLGSGTIRQLVADMLAIPDPPSDLVDLVIERSEGNPFFAAEHLRLTVSEGLLSRSRGKWLLTTRFARGDTESLLPLPRSIHQLAARRVAVLDRPARALLDAAAVLGREFDSELVATLMGGQEAVFDGIELLRRLQFLQRTGENTFRFVHDRLREAVYDMVPSHERRALHTSAARALELRHGWLPDAVNSYPRIAHHWANADQPQSAVRYLMKSARHAKSASANEDARRFYAAAIEQLTKARRTSSDPLLLAATVSAQEDFGDLLMLIGLSQQARDAYEAGLALVDRSERETRARFWRKLGRTYAAIHDHTQALKALARAEALLPIARQDKASINEWRERIEIRNEQIWSNYWLGDLAELQRLVAEQRVVVERIGTDLQRANFFRALCLAELRETRYRIQPSTLSYARAAWQAAEASHDPGETASTRFNLGFVLMVSGALQEAAEHMSQTVAAAERFGDLLLHMRAIAYHSVIARLQRHELTSALALKTKELAATGNFGHYLGIAQANLGWVEYAQAGHGAAAQLFRLALESWRAPPVYPLQWLAILPLLDVILSSGALAEAPALAAFVLEDSQQQLPDDIETRLRAYLASGKTLDLTAALQAARKAGFL
jgi:eukaryotic-like serine/threonine-protein kinase